MPIFSIFALWLLSTLGVSTTSASDVYRGVRLLVLLFAPGCYFAFMLGKTIRLRLDEILAIDIIISIAFTTLVSVYLSFPLTQITESAVSIGLLITTLLSALLCSTRLLEDDGLQEKVNYLNISKALICLIVSFLIGFLIVIRAIPASYWRGWDPWLNFPVTQIIQVEGLNPSELVRTDMGNLGMSGFYYFLTSVRVFTGIDCYTLTRFGGPILAGSASMITYLITKRIECVVAGFLASFFLCLNPFFVHRFSMALRENFAYFFFLASLFLLFIERQNQEKDWLLRFFYIFSIGLFSSVTLISHSLVSLILYGIIFLEIIFSLFEGRRDHALELLLSIFFSFIIAIPYLKMIISMFNWIMINQVKKGTFILIIFTLISSSVFFLIYYNRIIKSDFFMKHRRNFFLIMTVALLIGAFNSILFPKSFPILGSYNPPIKSENFATSILLLSILGFISILWTPISITIISFSLIIVLMINLTNLNVAFPLFRLVIYISWLLSYGSIKGLNFFYNLNFIKKLNINYKLILVLLKKNVIITFKQSIILCIVVLVLISPMILIDINSHKRGYAYHKQEDVDSTLEFASFIDKDDVIVPQTWSANILRYAGIDMSRIISDKELYSTNNPQIFYQIILSNNLNASRVLVFMINRRIGDENYLSPQLDMLNKYGLKQQIGTITFYILEIPFEFKEIARAQA